MKDQYVITIARGYGSGGRTMGKLLSEELGIHYYDRELLRLASDESGINESIFEKADEKKRFTLTGGFLGLKEPTLDGSFSQSYLWNEMLFKIQSDVIKDLAHDKSCIFVGRCADYILRDMLNTLNVFISAEFNDRVQRVKKLHRLSDKKAKELIEKTDKKRAGYYNYYSNKQWGAAESYHLCINSSILGLETTANFIRDFLFQKIGQE